MQSAIGGSALWKSSLSVLQTSEELEGKIVIGELVNRNDRKPFDVAYYEMVAEAQKKKGEKL